MTVDSIDNIVDSNDITVTVLAHSELHIGPDAGNSALRLGLKEFQTEAPDVSEVWSIQADATDYGPVQSRPFSYDSIIHLGQTHQSNADFIDATRNGAGIVKDIIADPKGPYNIGGKVAMYQPSEHAGCIRFVQELERRIFPEKPPNPDLVRWVADKQRWYSVYQGDSDVEPIKVSATKITVYGDPSKNEITRYTVPGPGQLELEFSNRPQGSGVSYADEHVTINPDQKPLVDPAEEDKVARMSLATGDGGETRNPLVLGDVCRHVRRRSLDKRQCSGGGSKLVRISWGSEVEKTGHTDMVFARVNKVKTTIKLVSQDVAVAAGVAGRALGAAFVILDLVHGEWVGGAFGAVGLALGVVTGFTVAGPVGWIVGGPISALFAILPGVISSQDSPKLARVDNMTEVIQYTMFGQSYITGNEECQKQNPTCQALYGPGTLSAVFGWENFDAIAFLINFNKGYPMSIPDMASAFQFNGTGSNSVATVDCHNDRQFRNNRRLIGDDPKYCNRPQFALSRGFVLPVINESATSVYKRIITTPGGDCKLVDATTITQTIPAYNLTINGIPVSIACNLSAAAAQDPSIPLLAANGFANASEAIVSPAHD
ncbi:MAG: hypothetical protein Q9221_007443 [Calogaya cf. arnoldii]